MLIIISFNLGGWKFSSIQWLEIEEIEELRNCLIKANAKAIHFRKVK